MKSREVPYLPQTVVMMAQNKNWNFSGKKGKIVEMSRHFEYTRGQISIFFFCEFLKTNKRKWFRGLSFKGKR